MLSKINANMLISCDKGIRLVQIKELQKFKTNPEKFDLKKDGFVDLVKPTFADYDLKSHDSEADGYEVDFTKPEQNMLN